MWGKATQPKPKPNEMKNMNNQFDELNRSLAQSVTRRWALKKFGVVLAGMALACFGVATSGNAGTPGYTTIDYPGAVFTTAPGINRFGDIVDARGRCDGN